MCLCFVSCVCVCVWDAGHRQRRRLTSGYVKNADTEEL